MDDFESPDTLASTKWGQDLTQVAEVRRSSLTNNFGSPPDSRKTSLTQGLVGTGQSSLSGIVQAQFPAGAQQPRRDSLRNMVHLCDFATP